MSPGPASSGSHGTASARFAGSGCAGALELAIFHPVDTIAKRLMNNKESFTSENWKKIVFQEKAELDALSQAKSLFPGIGYGAIYKISQRVYKFGGQPYVKDFVKGVFKPSGKGGKTFCDGLAGSFMGMGEVVLLPFDVLKIKSQTNPEYRGKGFVTVFRQEGVANLYAGWQWTMARNAPGSFSLFGANALVKEYFFQLEDHRDATFMQNTVSSTFGSVASILVACPLDVVKTRIQSGTYGDQGGFTIINNIVKNEGLGAFFKGATPKVLTVGPKLIFSFTIAQTLMGIFEKKWN